MPGDDEAARTRVEAAQAARDLRVKRFYDTDPPPDDRSFGEQTRELWQILSGRKTDIERDIDIKRRRDERLADRPIDRMMKKRKGESSKAWRRPIVYRRGSVR